MFLFSIILSVMVLTEAAAALLCFRPIAISRVVAVQSSGSLHHLPLPHFGNNDITTISNPFSEKLRSVYLSYEWTSKHEYISKS